MAKLLVLLAACATAANAKIFVFKADQCNVRGRGRVRCRTRRFCLRSREDARKRVVPSSFFEKVGGSTGAGQRVRQ